MAGKLRFQAPQPPLDQPGIQLANVQPAGCPQANNGNLSINPLPGVNKNKRQTSSNESIEDCLMLKSVFLCSLVQILFLLI